MFVSGFCCVSRGLCDQLITRPEESYGACVCYLETLATRWPRKKKCYWQGFRYDWLQAKWSKTKHIQLEEMTSFFCPHCIFHQESSCTVKFTGDSCNGHCC